MWSLLAALLLGPEIRAAEIVLDDDTKLVQLERWRLHWRVGLD